MKKLIVGACFYFFNDYLMWKLLQHKHGDVYFCPSRAKTIRPSLSPVFYSTEYLWSKVKLLLIRTTVCACELFVKKHSKFRDFVVRLDFGDSVTQFTSKSHLDIAGVLGSAQKKKKFPYRIPLVTLWSRFLFMKSWSFSANLPPSAYFRPHPARWKHKLELPVSGRDGQRTVRFSV